MKKMQKVLAVVLAVALLLSVSAVFAFAAEPEVTNVVIKTAPTRTVYYEGGDTYQDILVCDVEGMVFTVSYSDGTSEDVAATFENASLGVDGYNIGENTAMVYFYDANDEAILVEATFTITVKENPVESIEITKLPTKTEYDIEKDVITMDNFSYERLLEVAPEEFQEILDMYGMTYEEFVATFDEEEFKDVLFAKNDELLIVDSAGMEIRVTFKDGSYAVVTDEYDAIEYDGGVYAIMLEQKSNTVTEGENIFIVSFMSKYAEFNVTAKKAAANNGGNTTTDKPADKDDVKNPDIPKTGMAAGIAAAAVLMLSGTAGSALLLRRKEDQ